MMKKAIIFFILVMLFVIGYLSAEIRVKDINIDPYKYTKEFVKIKGKVLRRCGDDKTQSSKGYIFRDDYGDDIKVITTSDYPEVDQHYEVTGVVVVANADKDNPEISIIEQGRDNQIYTTSTGTMPTTTTTSAVTTTETEKKPTQMVYILFGTAVILLVLIGALLFYWLSNKSKTDVTTDQPSSSFPASLDTGPTDYPEPAEFIEDKTIKMSAPPEGTLKLLPGRLEIASGYDKVKEIRFYKLPSQEETEFTFGRSSGAPYVHIQVKSPTVSSKQAKLIWMNGKYMMLNYATTNPTKVDDAELKKDQSVPISEGSRIDMGEVSFIFHDK